VLCLRCGRRRDKKQPSPVNLDSIASIDRINPAYQGLEDFGGRSDTHHNALYEVIDSQGTNIAQRGQAINNDLYQAIGDDDEGVKAPPLLTRGKGAEANGLYAPTTNIEDVLWGQQNSNADSDYGTAAPLLLGGTERIEGAVPNATYGDQDATYASARYSGVRETDTNDPLYSEVDPDISLEASPPNIAPRKDPRPTIFERPISPEMTELSVTNTHTLEALVPEYLQKQDSFSGFDTSSSQQQQQQQQQLGEPQPQDDGYIFPDAAPTPRTMAVNNSHSALAMRRESSQNAVVPFALPPPTTQGFGGFSEGNRMSTVFPDDFEEKPKSPDRISLV